MRARAEAEAAWNLNYFQQKKLSVLRHICEAQIEGVVTPWLYFGNLFASFLWHNEDNYLYSINYHHQGAPKMWYGVASQDAAAFKQACGSKWAKKIHDIRLQLPPSFLSKMGVRVVKLVQNPRDFIVSFPQAYHMGFSFGWNCTEATNFATVDWLPFGALAAKDYANERRSSVISHERLLFHLAYHGHEFGPAGWKQIVAALSEVVRNEKALRRDAYARGVYQIEPSLAESLLGPLDKEAMYAVIDKNVLDDDEDRQCQQCKTTCVLSCVICQCKKKKLSCLHCYTNVCQCPPSHKRVVGLMPDSELDRILNHWEETLEAATTTKLPKMEPMVID